MKTRKWIFAMMLVPLVWMGCDDDEDNDADKPSLNSTDRLFVENAANSNMAEIELGNIAVTKATDSLVRAFAQQMITEHTTAQNELQDIADDFSGINWPENLDNDASAVKAQLDSIDAGFTFDSLYIGSQVSMHEDAVSTFEDASTGSTDTRVKGYAMKYLPKIQMHLDLADSLQAQLVRGDTTATDTTGTTD